MVTALSQSLAMLLIGWSLLEGIGAALIMPAVVALVASNFGRADRPRAYGLVASNFGRADRPRAYGLAASAGAIAVAAGPLIGGLFTTYASWRWVFVGEVMGGPVILGLAHRMGDTPAGWGRATGHGGNRAVGAGPRLGGVWCAQLGHVGIIIAKPEAPEWLVCPP